MVNGDRRRPTRCRGDDGAAIVEFIGLTLVLLIPVVYLIVTLSIVQAASFAAESAARDAARSAVVVGVAHLDAGDSTSVATAQARAAANSSVALVMEDYGFGSADQATMVLACSSQPCFGPGSSVSATVDVAVSVPGVPGWLTRIAPMTITVTADARSPVDGLDS